MKHSLVVSRRGRILFKSKGHGIRPLVICAIRLRKQADCAITDKVVGLAAAKIIGFAGFATSVRTPVCSEPAKRYLRRAGIALSADKTVMSIMNRDQDGVCPMEIRASKMSAERLFFWLCRRIGAKY